MNSRSLELSSLLLALAVGCGGGSQEGLGAGANAKTKAQTAARKSGSAGTIASIGCKADKADLESSDYDTSGDGNPDVNKVFRRVGGSGSTARLVLICREADLNGDGVKDVIRRYNDEGKPTREDADRDFEGSIDESTYFENGLITHRELDSDSNGVVDLKIYYDQGKPLRAERDIAKRSTATRWQPDVWEYYEAGKIVRIGTDLTGDGRVDRWDRSDSQKQASTVTEGVTDQPAAKSAEPEAAPDNQSKTPNSGG